MVRIALSCLPLTDPPFLLSRSRFFSFFLRSLSLSSLRSMDRLAKPQAPVEQIWKRGAARGHGAGRIRWY